MPSELGRIAIVLVSFMVSAVAFAELGGSESSVERDSQTFLTLHNKTQGPAYTTHELVKSTGTIKEFVLPNGKVFAVSWRGMKRPNLETLFGSYYNEYAQADQIATANRPMQHGRQSVVVNSPNVVVRRGGHMRDIHGQAVITSLVPNGVSVEDLK